MHNKFWITAPLPPDLTPAEHDALRTFLAVNASASASLTTIELSPQLNQATLEFRPNARSNEAGLRRLIATWQRGDLCTQAAAAAALGIPVKRISQAIREGRLPAYANPAARNPRRGGQLVSLAECRQLWQEEQCIINSTPATIVT